MTTGMDDWSEISRRMAAGDSDAFAQVYEACYEQVLKGAQRYTGGDSDAAKDIVQEVFLKLIRSMRPMRDERQLRGFVRVITKCVALDFLKAERRRSGTLRKFSEGHGVAESAEPLVQLSARIYWLTEQLQSLSEDQRQLLDWRYRLGWTLESIGSRLGLKSGAIDGRIRRVLQQLKRQSEECDDV
jgi:RNA polymerase sigma-70 factor (ECF subfamily)